METFQLCSVSKHIHSLLGDCQGCTLPKITVTKKGKYMRLGKYREFLKWWREIPREYGPSNLEGNQSKLGTD